MTVGELSKRMSAEEFLEWMAFDQVNISPDDMNTALLRFEIRRAGPEPVRFADLLPPRITLETLARPARAVGPVEVKAMAWVGALKSAKALKMEAG